MLGCLAGAGKYDIIGNKWARWRDNEKFKIYQNQELFYLQFHLIEEKIVLTKPNSSYLQQDILDNDVKG